MKERIRELSEGKVEYRKPTLRICPEMIDVQLDTDGVHHVAIMVETDSTLQVKGVAYSSHSRVVVMNPTFFGRTCNINLEINTCGLKFGAKLAGELTLVTNAGEKKIAYSFTMREKNYGSDERMINTMDDMADFAHEDPAGALKLFRSRAFRELPFMQNMNVLAIYQVLMSESDARRNMEAFLTYHGAKDAVTFSLAEAECAIDEITEPVKKTIRIRQDNWGYGQLTVTTDSPFIGLSADKITSDDTDEEGYISYSYTVFPGIVREGGKGKVVFHSSRRELTYTVSIARAREEITGRAVSDRAADIELMKLVTTYRAAQISGGDKNTSKLKKAQSALTDYLKEAIKNNPEDWEKKLLLIYFGMKNDRIEKADKALEEIREEVMKNRLTHVRAYCFFLYLRAVFYKSEEQMDTATKLIGKYYAENGQDPALMLLLLKTDATYVENPSLKLLKLKELYNAGCTSPMLYLEACDSYKKSPDLLRVLNEFELQAVSYGAKKNLLTEDLVVEIARLCGYEDKYRPVTYHLLVNMFEAYPIQIVLENICGYLIRMGCKSEKYFKWFELGIKSGISLVGINEAYLSALPKDWNKPLPNEILLYFSYTQNLRSDVREMLYENILTYIDENSQIYQEYKEHMEEYAITELLEGRYSKKLLPLYKKLIAREMIDERLAKVLPELLMTYEIRCSHSDMRKIVIRCPELNYEDTYSLVNGACAAPLYTDDCLIFFVDGFGNRYSDVLYEREAFFDDPTLLERCEKRYPDYLIFLLRKCKKLLEGNEITVDEKFAMDLVIDSAEVSEYFKLRLISRQLDQASSQKAAISDEILMSLELNDLSIRERKEALLCMVNNRHFAEVYEYISKYGVTGLEPDTLLVLAEQRIQRIKGAEELYLLNLCKYLFDKGLESVQVEAYLCSHYSGPSEQMRKILFACEDKPVIWDEMPERLLAQMLFTDDCIDIAKVFDIYRRTQKLNKLLVRAYQVYVCYHYFVDGEMLDERVFDLIYETLFGEETSDTTKKEFESIDIINIALLYYLTKNEDKVVDQLGICEILLQRLCRKGVLLGFYSLLWTKVDFPSELNGKVLLEHRGKGISRCYCTYGRMGSDEKTTILMQKVYDGIFVAQLVLFADETVEYSITEESDTESRVAVEKELLSNDLTFVRNGSSFESINDFSRMYAAGQEKQLEEALVQYEKRQHITNSLFMPL